MAAAQGASLGHEHPDTLRSQMNLAHFAADRGDLNAAEKLLVAVETEQ